MGELFVTSLEFSAKKWLQSEEALKLKTMKEKQDGFNKFIEDWVSTEMQTLKYKGLQDIFTGETTGDSGSEQTRPIDIGEFVTTKPKENIKKDKEEIIENSFDATSNKAQGDNLTRNGQILVGILNDKILDAMQLAIDNVASGTDFGQKELVLISKSIDGVPFPTGFEFITEDEFEDKYKNKTVTPRVTEELAQGFGFPPEVIKFLKEKLENFN